jgi:hypothetical protein
VLGLLNLTALDEDVEQERQVEREHREKAAQPGDLDRTADLDLCHGEGASPEGRVAAHVLGGHGADDGPAIACFREHELDRGLDRLELVGANQNHHRHHGLGRVGLLGEDVPLGQRSPREVRRRLCRLSDQTAPPGFEGERQAFPRRPRDDLAVVLGEAGTCLLRGAHVPGAQPRGKPDRLAEIAGRLGARDRALEQGHELGHPPRCHEHARQIKRRTHETIRRGRQLHQRIEPQAGQRITIAGARSGDDEQLEQVQSGRVRCGLTHGAA